MTNQKHKLKQCPFGTLAFRRLWAYSKGKRRTMKTQLPARTRKRMESSLKRCSTNQHRESDKDTAFNQREKKMNGQSNTRPVSAAAIGEHVLAQGHFSDGLGCNN
ncbi:uncharacterized protein LOC141607022 [Silene latifolia]|uniref:uncharacterized protein LOC141607022 n=1 Tax=Silene latifolia TaxID=37657 RepID=UPI003D781A25